MQPIYLLSQFRTHTRFILTASILGAFALGACERKPGTGDPAISPNPRLSDSPIATPPETIAEARANQPVAETRTIETVRLADAIDTFEKDPSVENHSSVKLAFAKLDGEIAELEDRVVKTNGSDRAEAAAKLDNLQKYRAAQMIRFPKAQDETALEGNPKGEIRPAIQQPADSRSATQKVEDTAVKVGDKIEDGAKQIGNTLEKAVKKTGETIKDATH